MTRFKCLSIFLVGALSLQMLCAQVKEEREMRIDLNTFPILAQSVVKQRIPVKHIKFYKEIDGDKTSFEAKFNYNGQRYSLEFFENGTIEDIEIKIKKRRIPKRTLETIEVYLNSNFDRFKFKKIQIQYLNSHFSDVISAAFEQKNTTEIRYEIIAEVKSNHEIELIEFTFSSDGDYQNQRIVKRTSYDHVLY